MNNTLPISVTILVKNAEKYLNLVLQALKEFDEVLLLDNGSNDKTLEIAQQFSNVVVKSHPFIGFGPMKNLAAQYAKNDWILNIDSDEVFPIELVEEIKNLDLNDFHKVYEILRLNHYRGKVVKSCVWYPDYVKRLYHRSLVQFNQRQVHESLEIPSNVKVCRLSHSFLHYSFDGAEDLIQKMQQYSSLFAKQNQFKKRASVFTAISHGFSAFVKHYFVKKGIMDGQDGWVISVANAMGAYYKYIKLMEANQKLSISLIITTYNRPDALSAVLQSVLVQTILPCEVIIADDGSTQATKDVIKQYQTSFPIPLIHSWQEDRGFRLAESRNRALAKARGEYIVVIDGDMIMHPSFIQDHMNNAKKGVFTQGSRVILPLEKTNQILQTPNCYPSLKWYSKGIDKRIEKKLSAIHLPCLNRIMQREKDNYYQGIRGCNMSFFREDALAINGFNNNFVGWGREDSEFVARFFNNGGKRQDIRFAAIAYHLWHNEAERDSLPENDLLLKNALEQKIICCENGVEQFIQSNVEKV